MINNKLNIDEIIIRYLDGTATDSDKEQLLTWLKESDKTLSFVMYGSQANQIHPFILIWKRHSSAWRNG